MKTILVKNSVVVNIVVSNEEMNEKYRLTYERVDPMPENYVVKIGAIWNGMAYNNPKQEIEN